MRFGGPVETGRGFVLHSSDYFRQSTLPVDDQVGADGHARHPARHWRPAAARAGLLALGYAGWGPGQLETEIQAMAGSIAPPTPALVFDGDLDANMSAHAQDRHRSDEAVRPGRPRLNSRQSMMMPVYSADRASAAGGIA